jgi:hypothetical protein
MVTKAKNYVASLRKKGGSSAGGTPQSGKAKAPPQPSSQDDPQDDPQDTKTTTVDDVPTYAAATLGKASGNKSPVVTTVDNPDNDSDSDKKMPAVDTPERLKDPPSNQGTLDPHAQKFSVRVVPKHTDVPDDQQDPFNALDDGLGSPWMPTGFHGGTPFSTTQSEVQFTVQTDDTQGVATSGQQDNTSPSGTASSFSTRNTTQQEDILLAAMNDLEDDPRDIMIYQMDEAISSIGGASITFDSHQKATMMEFWRTWRFTSWNSLHDELMDILKVRAFIQRSLHVIKDLFKHIDQNHPGHIMVATIVGYGPYYSARHISKLKKR